MNVHQLFFTILGYSISYLEFTAIVFTLACVILVAIANIWNWPMGIIGVSLYGILFYQYQLYSDMFLQMFFLMANIYGWYHWLKSPHLHSTLTKTYWATKHENIRYTVWSIVGILIMGWLMRHINTLLPELFPKPAAFPYVDSTIVVLSFAATLWQIKKRINQWILWILVDVIAITVYLLKNIPFTAILYFIFLLISIKGLFQWIKIYKISNNNS
jgi:nicotinamide mononucleotide transporter